jgi:HlyD family secretion protein
MPRGDSNLNMLIVAAILALGVGYYVPQTLSSRATDPAKADIAPKQSAATKSAWAASAPGRIEPIGGEVRLSSLMPGRIADVVVAVNDKVFAGDLLVRLDDEEPSARVHSALAEAAIRKRDRDNNEAVGKPAQDRRSNEDAVANAERQVAQNRDELDRLLKAHRPGGEADIEKARDAVNKAKERLDQARAGLRKALAVDGLPAPTRPEVSLAAARAELSAAEAVLERARIRSPSAGTILLVNAKVGETVAPSPENVLVVVGNVSSLRVRAEFEERDIGKVRVGQTAVVRSDAFLGKDFEGKVVSLAQALGPSRLGQRGPRKPTDVDVLEALIDLTGQSGLLPGMRVDVFLKPETTGQPSPAAGVRQPTTAAQANQ